MSSTTSSSEDSRRVAVLLVCSSGGHLYQLYHLKPWWQKQERSWVTFDTPDARSLLQGERVVWAHHPTTRHIPNLLRNMIVAWRVFRSDRPDVVVSDGAGVAFPFFALAKLQRIPTVYIESWARPDSATLTGRLCSPLATRFLLQWPEQKDHYPHGIVIGPLV